MGSVNKIVTVTAKKDEIAYLEIEVDGKPLAQHFVGRQGEHPSQISPLGWSSSSRDHRYKVVHQFLAQTQSELNSGRVPVLVCEECGDIACGAISVRILRESDRIVWTDWFYENGYEPGYSLEWPIKPGDFVFNVDAYEAEIRKALK
jgi:hypothetical protein